MAQDLFFVNPSFNDAGKFGKSMNGGNAYVYAAGAGAGDQIWALAQFTLQAWVKASPSGNVEAAAGRAGAGWIGKAADNTAIARYGYTPDVGLTSNVNIADGNWHFLELVVTGSGSNITGGKFFVDGVLVNSSTTTATVNSGSIRYFGVRAIYASSNSTSILNFTGEVDEVAYFNTVTREGNYSVPTEPISNTSPGLLMYYTLENSGHNSAGGLTPFSLTLQNATFNPTGKFNQSLNGGSGFVLSPVIEHQIVTQYPLTLQAWVKGTPSTNFEVAAGRAGVAWLGKAANNTALAKYGFSVDVELSSTINITDGVWHFLELVVLGEGQNATGGRFYVDGVLVKSVDTASTFSTNNQYFGIRAFYLTNNSNTATNGFTGEIDEVALYKTATRIANYTPPTAQTSSSEAGLVGLWRLNANGVNAIGAVEVAPDTTVPAFVNAQIAAGSPSIIQITFNEALSNSTPPASAFTVSGGRTVNSVAITNSIVSLTVNTAYANGDVVTVGYTKPAANPRLQDIAGNAVETFAGKAVTNNIPVNAPVVYDKTFTSDIMIEAGTIRKNEACVWSWVSGGAIGTVPGTVYLGSGTTTAAGKLVANAIPPGAGFLLVKFNDGGRYYQEGVAA